MTYTENYSLNQWAKTDRIQMADFNADNAKLDAALAGMPKIAVGTYTGTGTSEDTTVSVGFPVKALFVSTGHQIDGHNGMLITQGDTISGGSTGQVFWFTDDGFRVKTAIYNNAECTPYLNTAMLHRYVAIG